ncbi:MAG: hypothetical protein FWG98_02090 [Candidatus Cloacimonetes bacterium]|nr:hypothetical protein [Candidatus Cloacimonadota bacterium]
MGNGKWINNKYLRNTSKMLSFNKNDDSPPPDINVLQTAEGNSASKLLNRPINMGRDVLPTFMGRAGGGNCFVE